VSALLVAIGGACGVMARYVLGGIAAAACGYVLGRKLA
jgi:fluoride ion exporter CrcB/FEX